MTSRVSTRRKPVKRKVVRLEAVKKPKRARSWTLPLAILIGIVALIGSLVAEELRSSSAEAKWLSWYARQISFAMEPGPSPYLHVPRAGPYNERLGYSYLPFYIKALQSDNFSVAAQMRMSSKYEQLVRRGIYPIYPAKTVVGLQLFDRWGEKLYTASYPNHVFAHFEDIPPLLVGTLLQIENKELLEDGPPTKNPVIEWKRFTHALLGHVLHPLFPGMDAGGGSTLATQIEKFRFSPRGQTGNALEKVRQIASASLRVYQDGPDTREARKKIVLDYLNSTPLSARPGFGEINSIGDGLWAWFGIELNDAAKALNLPEDDATALHEKARVYRAALGLILAQRRPSYYLISKRAALENLIDATLMRLAATGVISEPLRAATAETTLTFLPAAPASAEPAYLENKAANALRTRLMNLLGLKKLYEIDRLDLRGYATLDQGSQNKLVAFLKKMGDREFLKSQGLFGYHLLDPANDPSKVKWSVMLYERDGDANKVRLQADNIDGPFDMNEGMKLDLGSTAKLRTVVTYLEIIAELHRRYSGLGVDDLKDLADDTPDNLTAWAVNWLLKNPNNSVDGMLSASLDRRYSGSPAEVFFTGSGAHTFHNFKRDEDFGNFTVHEAFQESVNLSFIRIMRDIVNYTMSQGPQTKHELLQEDDDAPARRMYLERFADQEGTVFLYRFIQDYKPLTQQARIEKLLARAHRGPAAKATIFRSVMPDADFNTFAAFMKAHVVSPVSDARLTDLYQAHAVDKYSLSDRAYISGINPMELWLVSYWAQHPDATSRELVDVSRPMRIDCYAWLFKSSKKHAQDTRIRIILEEDAFKQIQKRWARLGYPFERLVPSYATAIGSSADRPGALAELVGIILADGVRLPTERFEAFEFAPGTPYQTYLKRAAGAGAQQALSPAVARAARGLMAEVVELGTAKRVNGVYRGSDAAVLTVGGKTGTGDQRYDEFAAGGRLISSRVKNRTGTFVFYIGDRFFGTITAHVAGEEAEAYDFTSALSAQMLAALQPIINPLVNGMTHEGPNPSASEPVSDVSLLSEDGNAFEAMPEAAP